MKIEQIISFRSPPTPICTSWTVGSHEAFGVLTWEGKTPLLRLSLEGFKTSGLSNEIPHPVFAETKPPSQPKITGKYPGYGIITLENCCQSDWYGTVDFKTGFYTGILTLLPTQIWIGTPREQFDAGVSSLTLSDSRLAGFFGSPGMRQHFLQADESKVVFDALGEPACVWTYHEGDLKAFELDYENLTIHVGGSVSSGASSKTGYSAQSFTEITISSSTASSFEILQKIKTDIEQILSIFSLESFSFEFTEYSYFNNKASLVWYLGEDREQFEPPMRHQILVDFRAEGNFEKVCKAWLHPSEELTLSRWLFCKALQESEDGLSRFITVAQALEVLGRSKGPSQAISKCDFKRAIASIAEAIKDFDQTFVDRIIGLVSSSNKCSFRHMLEYMIGQATSSLGETFTQSDIETFSKLISDTRNALVHMTTTKKSRLNGAFAVVNKLSLRVTFWYAVILASDLGIQIPDYKRFLFNNRVARHGLPNDVLERSSAVTDAATPS